MICDCEIWCTIYNSRLGRIISLQKEAMRIVCNVGYRDHTNQLYCNLKSLNFNDVVEFKCMLLMYTFWQNLHPPQLRKNFSEIGNIHRYYIKSTSQWNLYCVYARTTTLNVRCIIVLGVNMWNNLETCVKISNYCNKFHSKLNYFILFRYN